MRDNDLSQIDFLHYGIEPTSDQLDQIASFKKNNFARLSNFICQLNPDKKSENQIFFNQFFKAITTKFDSAEEIIITKKTESKLVFENLLEIYVQEDNEIKGGQATVKKGYDSEDFIHPTYTVKTFSKGRNDYVNKNRVKKEAKYARAINRLGFFSSTTAILPWIKGTTLLDSLETIGQLANKNKLNYLSTYFYELEKLHQNNRVHGDIKPENVIIDLEDKSTLRLIDFGFSQKANSSKNFFAARYFQDLNKTGKYTCAEDIYSSAFIVSVFFPDIFYYTEERNCYQIMKKGFGFTPLSQAITLFVDRLQSDIKERCLASEALNYCNALISNFDHLDDETVNAIYHETIGQSGEVIESFVRYSN